MSIPELLYIALALPLGAWSIRWAKQGHLLLGTFGLAPLLIAPAFLIGGVHVFLVMRLLAWGGFVVAPLALLGQAVVARRGPPAILALLLILVGLDAFVREPHDLQLVHYTVTSDQVRQPVRVAVLSDVQTDHVGDYERLAFARTMAEQPDLILLPGDFVQRYDDARPDELARFADLLRTLKAPLGVHAVAGNSEHPTGNDWALPFADAGVHAHLGVSTFPAGPDLVLTSLPLAESSDGALVLPRPDRGLHLVFGHAPDFAMGPAPAELMIAGHTHGGQVRVPFFGPLVTFSNVPRSWAGGGMVEVAPGKHLVVSRGVGMERMDAPRMRLNCRPQIVIVDVVPGG